MVNQGLAYRGHEQWFNSLRMYCKMLNHAVLWSMAAQMTTFLLSVLFVMDLRNAILALKTFSVKLISCIPLSPAVMISIYEDIISNPAESAANAHYQLQVAATLLLWSLPVAPVMFFSLLGFFRSRALKQALPQYVRGTVLKSDRQINSDIRKAKEKWDLKIGTINFPVSAENKSVFIIGSPGKGKTQLLNPVIEKAKRRPGTKGIVFDLKNEFFAVHGTEKDLLFNPVDIRTLRWTVFNDIRTTADIELIVTAILPTPPGNTDPIWIGGARDILSSILRWCHLSDNRTNRAVWECMTMPRTELKARFEETPGCERALQHMAEPDSRQTSGFFTEIMVYAGFLEYMAECDGDFSINSWLESGQRWIFIASMPKLEDMLRPATSLFLSVAIASHLSLPQDLERRIFFFLDEMAALGRLPNIEKIPLQLRSKGGSLWCAVQDFSKMDDVFDRLVRNSIVNGCGTFVSFGVEDYDTAEAVARKIGKQEFYQNEVTYSYGVGDNRDGETSRNNKLYEYVILPEELMEMRSLHCVASISEYGKALTRIPLKIYKEQQQGFMPNPIFDLKTIAENFRALKQFEGLNAHTTFQQLKGDKSLNPDKLEECDSTGEYNKGSRKAIELDIDQY